MNDHITNPYATFADDVPQKNKQQPWMQSSEMRLPQEIVGMSVRVTPVGWETKKPVNAAQLTTYRGRNEDLSFCPDSDSFYSDESFLGFIDSRPGTQRDRMYGVLSKVEWDENAEAFYCASYIAPYQRFEIKPLPGNLLNACRRSLLRLIRQFDM